MALLEGFVKALSGSYVTITRACGPEYCLSLDGSNLKVGDKITFGVRPELIQITNTEGSPFKVRLDVSEHLGADTYCHVRHRTAKR